MQPRADAIKWIFDTHPDAIFIASTGYISRAVHALYPEHNGIFYMQGSMGMAPAIGLGMALNTDREVVVISGDAALLMQLGITHTIRDANLPNLSLYVLDNGCHESVGGFECSLLEDSYPGVTKIIKISKDGKDSRVALSCEENSKNIKELLCNGY